MQYEVELRKIPEQVIVRLGGRGAIRDLRERATRLTAALDEAGVTPEGPLMARFLDEDEDYDPDDTDYEVCFAISPSDDEVVPDHIAALPTAVIPAHHALVARHNGPYSELGGAHAALQREIDAAGYAVAGPTTEVFLVGPAEGRLPADYLTELRYPIAR